MKRKLLQQMRNEWRSNIWMCIELVVTGLILWVVFSIFAFLSYLHKPSDCYDFNDVYAGDLRIIPKTASSYTEYPDSLHNENTDVEMLLTKLRNNQYVECAGIGLNALPYTFNYSGNDFSVNVGDSVQTYHSANVRRISPEMVRVLRVRGIHGETTEEIAGMIADNKLLPAQPDYSDGSLDLELWRGRDAWWSYDSTRVAHVGAIVGPLRRTDYEPLRGMVLTGMDNTPGWWDNIAIRVRPGKGRAFSESIKPSDLQFGNVYISTLESMDNRRERAHESITRLIGTLTMGASFLMAAVFLGFLGSFWFRTQQRVPELALRRANGATRSQLFRRMLSEGIILLISGVIVILFFIVMFLCKVNLSETFHAPIPSWIPWAGFACSISALALMIIGGIWMPASKAMKINPAEALKEE